MVNEEINLLYSPSVGSKISRCMVVNGAVKSCEPIIVDGTVNGNIVCDDSVVVQKSGIVNGKIEAKTILLEGKVEGPLEANTIELREEANLTGYILAKRAKIAGSVDGDILAKEYLEVSKDARLITYECVADTMVVKGYIQGEVTANIVLDIRASATIEGDIRVRELKAEGSSKIFGSISRIGVQDEASDSDSFVNIEGTQEEEQLRHLG